MDIRPSRHQARLIHRAPSNLIPEPSAPGGKKKKQRNSFAQSAAQKSGAHNRLAGRPFAKLRADGLTNSSRSRVPLDMYFFRSSPVRHCQATLPTEQVDP